MSRMPLAILVPILAALFSLLACNRDLEKPNNTIASKDVDSEGFSEDKEKAKKDDEEELAPELNPILVPPMAGGPLFGPDDPGLRPPLFGPILGGGGGGGRSLRDECPQDNLKLSPGVCGCGTPDVDVDQDAIFDCLDNCPALANPTQVDSDEDGVGALCDCDDASDGAGEITGTARYVAALGSDTANNCLERILPCRTISHAISVSDAGDTILAESGTFLEDTILVDKDLNILGEGPANTIVDADQDGRVFLIAEGISATICGLSITGGSIIGMGSDVDQAPGGGGGVFNDGTLLLSNVLVEENHANLVGGGVFNNIDSVMTIRNSTINLNTADNSAAGVANYYLSSMTIDNSSITNNTAGFVGGAGGSAGDLFVITNSIVSNNSASALAGAFILIHGLTSVGSFLIQNTEFSENAGAFGGALITNGIAVTIEDSQFLNNDATEDGGAIAVVDKGILQISDSTFSGNEAILNGGAMLVNEDSRAFIIRSTLDNNSATQGGGILVSQTSEIFLTNSTLSANTASLLGGGIFETGTSEVNLNLSTLAFNTAPTGGGVYKTSDSNLGGFQVIVSDNTTNDCAADVGDVFNNASFSLFSDLSCSFTMGANNIVNTDPLLGPLQNNGGPTETHALTGISPAIDAGDTNCLVPVDQRGEFRPVNIPGLDPIDAQARCDIGSFEVQLP